MKKYNKSSIVSALSVATLMLLEGGCGGNENGDSDSNTTLAPNETAPELIGTWGGSCIVTSNPTANLGAGAVSFTGVSGGGGGGGGGSTGGTSKRTNLTFNQNGSASGTVEYFAISDCNTTFSEGFYNFAIRYTVGGSTTAADGSPAIEINLIDDDTTTYSIFQVVNSIQLYLGDEIQSNPGNDGTTLANRFDRFGLPYSKR